jgi:CheY-like chemotaxis protein/HAMP domain-containing protein
MNFLKYLSVRTKLTIASAIPLIGLLYYLQLNIRNEIDRKQSAQVVLNDVAEVKEISHLLHETQKERALTLTYLSGERKFSDLLASQRDRTDEAVSSWKKLMTSFKKNNPISLFIDSLAAGRAKVDELKPVAEVDAFYFAFKQSMLNELESILRETDNMAVKNQFEEHLFLLHAKDFLAQIRSNLSPVFEAGKFTGSNFRHFASLKGMHEFSLQKFLNVASRALKKAFESQYNRSFVNKTYRIIDSAYTNPAVTTASTTFDDWWSTSTGSINALKEVEDVSTTLIIDKARNELTAANENVTRNLIIAALVILVNLLVVVYSIKTIIASISKIRESANRMTSGETDIELNVSSKDEIGALASSFNKMIHITREYSMLADAIGKGDYNQVVNIRSKQDTLGIALDRMKTNLQTLSHENEIRTWLLTGNSEMNDSLRGEKDVKEMAALVITQLVNYLKAQIGAIYIKENGSYILTGSYAFRERKNNISSFREGEGLVGQAALEKKPIIFSEIPGDYVRISSGLGNAIPKNIIVYPFLYDQEVKGVIEIGTAGNITELDMQLLNMVSENIGIAVHGAQSRALLKDLLEETQRQAEELEAQQEELKQSNEELLEKTSLLEKSEAELKVQQEELQQTNEELEEKANLLEEQKEKLEHAKMDIENKARELEVTSRYKSEFLANMSHELRTPLNSVLILAQLLAENKNKSLGQKEVEFARTIYNSGTDLLMLINEILDLSKVESGKMELDIEKFPVTDIREDLNAMFFELAKNKKIGFTIEINPQVKEINTDKQRLEQVLRNLLSNAFKFTSADGTIKLSIAKVSKPVSFRNRKLYDLKNIIAFAVTDTGIGIPESKQSVIFEAFQQADGSTKRKYGGTGLGLSISRELANVLGGEIHLQSIEGKGSTFTLYIPAEFDESISTPMERIIEIKDNNVNAYNRNDTEDRQALQEVAGDDDRYNLNPADKIVLIMEDDAEYAKVLRDFIRERNYKAIIAHEGTTGLSYARHYKPDAIILDMKMPVMDGTEVLRQLKNDPGLRHIPVQIISGYDKRKEGLQLGAFDYIQKPIRKEDLQSAFDKIESFISKKLKKLLIVEDDPKQNKAICELIGNGDVKCVSAYSGQEACNLFSKENFECIIVDLGLPDMTGFDLLKKLKPEISMKNVPVIVYTARDLSKEESQRLNRLANTVVLKTVNSHERLLDETTLFLHRVESRLPKEKQHIIRQLHKTDEVLKGKKVLVVDDDIRNIYSLTNILEEEGMLCITAENGKIALKALKENKGIDLVLMDVMMPEMDGYEATKEIKKMYQFSSLPIIALTAKAMKGDREKCLESGMSDYISKPVNVEQLLSLMRVWLYQ